MTRDEALLLAAANARGVCRLTLREAQTLNRTLLDESERLRLDLAAASLREAQVEVNGVDVNRSTVYSLERSVAKLQDEIAHMRDVQEAMQRGRYEYKIASLDAEIAASESTTANSSLVASEN